METNNINNIPAGTSPVAVTEESFSVSDYKKASPVGVRAVVTISSWHRSTKRWQKLVWLRTTWLSFRESDAQAVCHITSIHTPCRPYMVVQLR